MSKAIRAYMAETITAFQLDEALFTIADATQDGTVKAVAKQMWFHYDDCKDHKIVSSKQTWDYFNRLLLLLESEAEAEFVRTRTSWRAEWHSFFHTKDPSAAEIAIVPFPSISNLLWLRPELKHSLEAGIHAGPPDGGSETSFWKNSCLPLGQF